MGSIHPTAYEDDNFAFYLEKWNNLNIVHVEVKKLSHNTIKKMRVEIKNLAQQYGAIYGYGENNNTYRLMKMGGFRETDIAVFNNHSMGKLWVLFPPLLDKLFTKISQQ